MHVVCFRACVRACVRACLLACMHPSVRPSARVCVRVRVRACACVHAWSSWMQRMSDEQEEDMWYRWAACGVQLRIDVRIALHLKGQLDNQDKLRRAK